jgi:hypothetical protein
LQVSKNSYPDILKTTFTSITFSLLEIVEKVNEEGLKQTINWYVDQKIYLRSGHVIVFIIFAYLLVFILKKRQNQIVKEIQDQNENIVSLTQSLKTLETDKSELHKIIDELKVKEVNLVEKMKIYESIVNPPIDFINFENILQLDPESIIFKCRKVAEKIIILLYEKYIGSSKYKNLDTMIKDLKYSKILNTKAFTYANTIKAFGNISAHPDIEKPSIFSQKDAKIISNALVLFIEEINETSKLNNL